MPFESAKTPLNFSMLAYNLYVEVSSNKGYLYGVVPITRVIIFWSLDWGPLILGNYHITLCKAFEI